ncbi:MAG TPA: winged helix-turn-helix domain-containing protein [Conexivisphaerales archaeon]|nr:winged helix-turn-helix domain-containing protein [Conexivisphaerales archaeon]
MNDGQADDGFSRERAELFEALGHPIRLEILRALSESPLGFADLKRKVNVTSSGHLTHHLEKLDGLVRTTPEGLYALTDDGKEALRIASTQMQSSRVRTSGMSRRSWAVLAIGLALVVSGLALTAFGIPYLSTQRVPSEVCALGGGCLPSSTLVPADPRYAIAGTSLLLVGALLCLLVKTRVSFSWR